MVRVVNAVNAGIPDLLATTINVKNQWSPNAAMLGVLIALLLATVSYIPSTFVVGLFCPSAVILGRAIDLLHVSFSQWMLFLLIPISAVGNALWYMLLAEAFRLSILSPRSKSHN
jgi:hypothetical protein